MEVDSLCPALHWPATPSSNRSPRSPLHLHVNRITTVNLNFSQLSLFNIIPHQTDLNPTHSNPKMSSQASSSSSPSTKFSTSKFTSKHHPPRSSESSTPSFTPRQQDAQARNKDFLDSDSDTPWEGPYGRFDAYVSSLFLSHFPIWVSVSRFFRVPG